MKHAMHAKGTKMAKEMDAMVKATPAHAMPKKGAKKGKGGGKKRG